MLRLGACVAILAALWGTPVYAAAPADQAPQIEPIGICVTVEDVMGSIDRTLTRYGVPATWALIGTPDRSLMILVISILGAETDISVVLIDGCVKSTETVPRPP